MKKWQLIDLVRSFCILTVLARHSGFTTPAGAAASFLWTRFERNGAFGVCLFFVVSGFLITQVIANGPGGLYQPDLKKFYVQRAGRILPLLILVVSVGAVCTLFYMDSGSPRPFWGASIAEGYDLWFWLAIPTFSFNYLIAFKSYSYLTHWAVLWSLSVEEQFYAFFPMLLRKLGNDRNLSRFLITVILLSLAGRMTAYFLDPQIFKWLKYLLLFDQIAVGVLLFLAYRKFHPSLSENQGLSRLVATAGFVLFSGTYLLTSSDRFSDLIFAPLLLAVGASGLLLGGLHLTFFESKGLRLFSLSGKYCYGGYLLHPWVLHFLRHPLLKMNVFGAFALFALVTTMVSGLSYHFFEMPANQLIRSKFGSAGGAVEREPLNPSLTVSRI